MYTLNCTMTQYTDSYKYVRMMIKDLIRILRTQMLGYGLCTDNCGAVSATLVIVGNHCTWSLQQNVKMCLLSLLNVCTYD